MGALDDSKDPQYDNAVDAKDPCDGMEAEASRWLIYLSQKSMSECLVFRYSKHSTSTKKSPQIVTRSRFAGRCHNGAVNVPVPARGRCIFGAQHIYTLFFFKSYDSVNIGLVFYKEFQ